MALIKVTNLSFAYDGSYDLIFDDVSFQIDTRWKLGFIGRNGRGKTTFLRLLLGVYEYRGRIDAPVSFQYFPYEVADPKKSVLDVFLSIDPSIPRWKTVRELEKLEMDEEILARPFDTLSNGERTRALLAVLFCRENSFLLIDEPTNHLDMAARESVGRYLRSKEGFILVSHDRALLDGCVDHVLSINKTNIEVQSGNFSTWFLNKQRQDRFEQAENERLIREKARLEKTAREKSAWSDRAESTKYATKNSGLRPDRGHIGHKAEKMMKRAKTMERRREAAINEQSKLLKNIEKSEQLKIHPLPYHQNRLVELIDVSIRYGDTAVCEHVGFTVAQGDRIALTGRNGSGKSSVLKLILGEPLCYTGTFLKGSRLEISYVAQDTSFLQGPLSEFVKSSGVDDCLFKTILRKLDFSREQFEKNLSSFSGGQKKKVLLAKSLSEQAHLYVWDEPLNFVDVLSRVQIEELLLTFQPTLLFVEHDRAFCERIATKTVRLS